jgi:hypothetical protein
MALRGSINISVVVVVRMIFHYTQQMASPLKHQTRIVACFPNATGFAIGSTEGRVGIQYLDAKQAK